MTNDELDRIFRDARRSQTIAGIVFVITMAALFVLASPPIRAAITDVLGL